MLTNMEAGKGSKDDHSVRQLFTHFFNIAINIYCHFPNGEE